ncbi:MAG: glycosyltransferase [Pseudomonadota bacterium]|nr:glycosyltransferase [Pseudomonadota bacterium]
MAYDISVIIPAYSAETFIVRAVRSLQRQGPLAIETIICADDGVDYTAILRGHGIDTTHIRQCRTAKPASGPAAARNAALALAQADVIACLDADDEFLEGRLPALIGAVGQLGAVTGPTVEFSGGQATRQTVPAQRGYLTVADICGLRMPLFPVFRREFAGGGWPDLPFAEDMIFNAGLATRVPRYGYVEEAVYCYHQHPGSLTGSDQALARARAAYDLILVHLDGVDWPQDARNCVRNAIHEDIANADAALARGETAWRGTVS